LSLTDANRQFLPEFNHHPNQILLPERVMIADIQTPEFIVVAAETQELLTIVQDVELLYVGGGSTGCLF